MTSPYEELIGGEWLLRLAPRLSHETICACLHRAIGQLMPSLHATRLLPQRSLVALSDQNQFRPDLGLVTIATGKLWLAAEIINQEDHHADTVLKKAAYEELHLPRLWMIDPRYENVEVYHATPYGLSLRETLMVKETLVEPLLPGFQLSVRELFSAAPANLGSASRDF